MRKMTLERWYGSALIVPNSFTSWRYSAFAISCFGMTSTIIQRNLKERVVVRFINGIPTAHADQETNTIAISTKFLFGNLSDVTNPPLQLQPSEALTVIMGIIVHEAAHFAYSPPLLTTWAEYIERRTSCVFLNELAMTLGNVVEDIFIEAEVDRQLPLLTWSLDYLNDLILPEDELLESFKRYKDLEEAPLSIFTAIQLISDLIAAKVLPSIESTPYITDLFQLARSATTAKQVEERYAIALTIYEKVMANITKEEIEENSAALLKLLADLVKASRDSIRSTDDSFEGKPIGKFTADTVTEITNNINHSLDSYKDATIDVQPSDYTGDIDSIMTFVEKPVKPWVSGIEVDKRYAVLAELARQRATVNRPYGLDRRTGHSIRKLYRIATDEKIFAEPQVFKGFEPMQVIILIDCSGSMTVEVAPRSSREYRVARGSEVSRLEAAAKAAAGAAHALMAGRCEVAIYGHSADVINTSDVHIYAVKHFHEPASFIDTRCAALVKSIDISRKENRDGHAIAFVGKKFTKANKRRLLIVISDGAPAAGNYWGNAANDHTKAAVDKLRRNGIDVISISITDGANLVNSQIYGKANNISNNDPHVIKQVIENLILA